MTVPRKPGGILDYLEEMDLDTKFATPVYIAPTLLNGWVNYGSEFHNAGYYKDPLSRVHLRGLIKDGATALGTVLFVLPTGYRPSATLIVDCQTFGAIGQIYIKADGNVLGIVTDAGWLSLDTISFTAV